MWCLLFSGSVSRMAHEVLHSPFIGYLNQKLSLFYGPVSALSPRISQIARHGFHVFVYPAFHDDDLIASENLEKKLSGMHEITNLVEFCSCAIILEVCSRNYQGDEGVLPVH
jgi:hypothetical protein